MVLPIFSTPWWAPKAPVNNPYPKEIWTISSFVNPAELNIRADISVQVSKSFLYNILF